MFLGWFHPNPRKTPATCLPGRGAQAGVRADGRRNRRSSGMEVFAPEMTVDHPVYRFGLIGQPPFKVDGRDTLVALYSYWAETNQSIFYAEDETLAVGDNMIISRSVLYQQQLGSDLRGRGVDADEDAMYLMKANIAMIWPYDDRGRMIGEDVWEYDDTGRDFIKLDAADVLSTKQAATLLDPFIQPLPPVPTRSG